MGWSLIAADEHDLARYAQVPMAITVEAALEVEPLDGGLGGLRLIERPVAEPYVKDYDEHGGPATWPDRFGLSGWRIVIAAEGDEVLGGAATLPAFPGEPPTPIATLWDIRVRADVRRQGIGQALLHDARTWAREHGFRWLRAETQNVNLAACRFYHGLGASLGAVDRFAYAGQPAVEHEIRLDWLFATE
jgi:GNAT superfamily N-acetyltransferase